MNHSNELALVPAGTQPRYRIVEPKLSIMEKRISQLDTVINKLVSNITGVYMTVLTFDAEKAISEDEFTCRLFRRRFN